MSSLFSHVGFIEKLAFTKHLSVMIKSGITVTDALETLIPETKNEHFRALLSKILADIENGQPLSKALSRYPDVFDQLYVSLIRVGEESGTMDENLVYLAAKLTKEHALKKKVQNVMLYPSLVITIATAVGGYISIFVLPQLVNFFDSMKADLPLSTRILLAFSTTMRDYGIAIFVGLGIACVVARYVLHLPSVKPYWHAFLLKLPVLGKFLQSAQMAAFCRNLGVMLRSGLSITTALEVERDASDNLVFKEYMSKLYSAVLRGRGVAHELSTFSYVPPIAVKMIAVGEKTGRLDESLIYLGDFFEEEVDSAAKNFSTVLEPVIFIVIGLVVAFLAFSIITPIYQLTGNIRGR